MLGAVLQPKVLVGIRLFIWLLSTRLGTVILCGRNGLSKTFPYFQLFSNLPRKQQEKVLQQWSRSSFTIFQAVYKLFKMLTLWAVYCKVQQGVLLFPPFLPLKSSIRVHRLSTNCTGIGNKKSITFQILFHLFVLVRRFQPSTLYFSICAVTAMGMANLQRRSENFPSPSNEDTVFAHICDTNLLGSVCLRCNKRVLL